MSSLVCELKNEMNKLNKEALDEVVGGMKDVVYNDHPGYPYANCRKNLMVSRFLDIEMAI